MFDKSNLLPHAHSQQEANDYNQEIPQSQTNTRHREEETQNTNSHTTAKEQSLFFSEVIVKLDRVLNTNFNKQWKQNKQ